VHRIQNSNNVSIRYVQDSDYSDLIPLIKKKVKAVLPEEEFNEEKIKELFEKALNNENVTGIVLSVNNKIEGYILGIITEHYFHTKKIAFCMAIYVSEEYRKYGIEMIKSFEAWGKYKKADTLSISSFISLSPDNLEKVYTNLFKYNKKEQIFWKEIS
jgi:hypothetical protein